MPAIGHVLPNVLDKVRIEDGKIKVFPGKKVIESEIEPGSGAGHPEPELAVLEAGLRKLGVFDLQAGIIDLVGVVIGIFLVVPVDDPGGDGEPVVAERGEPHGLIKG